MLQFLTYLFRLQLLTLPVPTYSQMLSALLCLFVDHHAAFGFGGYREGLSVITPRGLSGDVISDQGLSGGKPTK